MSNVSLSGRAQFVCWSIGGCALDVERCCCGLDRGYPLRLERSRNRWGRGGSPGCDNKYNFLSATLVINGPTAFVNNTSGANGGALALSEGFSASIVTTNVSFLEDAADVAGGAIHVFGSGIGPVFTGLSFVSNSAQVGGAVSTLGVGNLRSFGDVGSPNPTTYDRCIFIDNRASATGGAIESASGKDSIHCQQRVRRQQSGGRGSSSTGRHNICEELHFRGKCFR